MLIFEVNYMFRTIDFFLRWVLMRMNIWSFYTVIYKEIDEETDRQIYNAFVYGDIHILSADKYDPNNYEFVINYIYEKQNYHKILIQSKVLICYSDIVYNNSKIVLKFVNIYWCKMKGLQENDV